MNLYQKYKNRIKPSYITLLMDVLEDSSIMDPINLALKRELKSKKALCPDPVNIYAAFNQHEVRDLKVVILGQDPYHTPSIANGLAFATAISSYQPPSLRNLLHKVAETKPTNFDGETLDLNYAQSWGERQAKQGVLLLNTALTTVVGKAGAHSKLWEPFTNKAIKNIAEKKPDLIWVLMGSHAIKYRELITKSANGTCFITSSHPSPLSCERRCGEAPSFNSVNILTAVNTALEMKDLPQINW